MRHESRGLGRSVKVRDIIKLIQVDGWVEVRTKGSHRHFAHQSKSGVVTIAGHDSQDVPLTTLRQIAVLRSHGLVVPPPSTEVLHVDIGG